MSLKVRLRPDKKNKRGEAPIYIQYIHNGKNYMFSSGAKVALDKKGNEYLNTSKYFTDNPRDRNKWVSSSYSGHTTLNKKIKAKYDEVDKLLASIGDGNPTIQEVREANNKKERKKTYTQNLCDLFEQYINVAFKEKSPTRTAKLAALSKLRQYNSTINVKSLDLNFIDKFTEFMSSELNLAKSTIGKTIKDLKAAIYYFDDRGWIDKETFYRIPVKKFNVGDYRPQHKEDKTYLEKDELNKLVNCDRNSIPAYLRKTLDRHIIQCQTGLRVSDLHRIDKTMIKEDEIVMFAQKTNKEVFVPLTKKVKHILEENDNILPSIPDPVYNRNLKTLYKLLGFDRAVKLPRYKFDKLSEDRKKDIIEWQANNKGHRFIENKDYEFVPLYSIASTHMGVRTFITIAEELGLTLKTVCEITGKTAKVIQNHYWGKNKKARIEGMNKFDKAFSA